VRGRRSNLREREREREREGEGEGRSLSFRSSSIRKFATLSLRSSCAHSWRDACRRCCCSSGAVEGNKRGGKGCSIEQTRIEKSRGRKGGGGGREEESGTGGRKDRVVSFINLRNKKSPMILLEGPSRALLQNRLLRKYVF